MRRSKYHDKAIAWLEQFEADDPVKMTECEYVNDLALYKKSTIHLLNNTESDRVYRAAMLKLFSMKQENTNKILILDIETTGFSHSKNRIVEIGIVEKD